MTTLAKSEEDKRLAILDEEPAPLTLVEMEELILKNEVEGRHQMRSRGQIETARELRAIAFSNIVDMMYEDENGVMRMHKLTDLPREVTASIKKIKVQRQRVRGPKILDQDGESEENYCDTSGEIVEIELWNKEGALDKLMKHYGGYEEDNNQKAEGVGKSLDMLMSAISDAGAPDLDMNALPSPIDNEDDI